MINRIILLGRLTADPEIRHTQSGLPVVNFNLAVDRNYKNAAGERETDFIRCIAWRKAAELIHQYSGKGHLIGVEGSLRMNKYQTKEGENRTTYEVEIDNFQFLDRGGSAKPQSSGTDDPAPPPQATLDDDLPF